MENKIIAFTVDIDWAPDEAISDTLQLFEQYGVPATLFCTHDSGVLKNANRSLFELGVHPNFNPLLLNTGHHEHAAKDVLDKLMEIYPEATGVRSHSMTQNSYLLNLFVEKGLVYDANSFWAYDFDLKPKIAWNGLRRVPYNWEDDIHFEYGFSYDDLKVDFKNGSYFVFDFHPCHVALNTDSKEYYGKFKEAFYCGKTPMAHRNTANAGARDALIKLLEWVVSEGHSALKMSEVAKYAQKP